MDVWLDAIPMAGLGSATLATAVIFMILRGWLVPRRVLLDAIEIRDKQIIREQALADQWREAFLKSEEGRHVAIEQSNELIDGLKTTFHALDALPKGG